MYTEHVQPLPDRLVTVPEAAQAWGVHPATVRRHIAAGHIPAVRIWRGIRVRLSDVENIVKHGIAPTTDDGARGAA